MVLRDEQADILGGPILQRPESGVLATLSQHYLVFKSATLFGLALLVWVACIRGLEHLKKHRELRYRKAMRRKHGIPDSDCRPFAVAYAAAKRAHLQREVQDRNKTTNDPSNYNPPAVDQRTHAQEDACVSRKRVPETTMQLRDHLPGKHDTLCDQKCSEVLDFTDRYNPKSSRRAVIPEASPILWPFVRRTSRREPLINRENEESRKRSFEHESDVEHETIKKSRIDAEQLDGVEQADWDAQHSDSSSQRVSKGSADRQPENHLVYMNGHERFQRGDDACNTDHGPDEAMEGIDEDQATVLKAVARGKKRDWAEAGSTFGGDDEDDFQDGRESHHRKRRTISRRKAETPSRGKKRDREAESPESEDEGVSSETSGRRARRSSKKKRGKKTASDEVNEISGDDPRVSKDPLCGGRGIGDEWDTDGVQYKVGGKGERLRLTLVKKARNKYHMPQDSQHPDRSAALEIYVEMWMTEEQYKEAEFRHELAWQGASRQSNGSKTPDVLRSPAKNGKSLLWDSVKCSPARPFRQFMPPAPSARVNPFEQWQSQPLLGRRVASSSTTASFLLPGIADSPTRPGFRGFSKWEKQDREAEAMARIRAKIEEEKKAQVPEIRPSVTAPELGIKPSSVPTITITPVPAAVADGKVKDSTSQSKLNTSTFSFPSSSSPIKGATIATSDATISSSIPATTPSTLFPSASPMVPTTTSSTSSLSPLLSAKLPPATASPGGGAPSSSTLSPSMLGATTQLQPPSTESMSKPPSFFFTKPDISSSPTVVGPPRTQSETTPMFNSTSPVTFGFTPVTTKAETAVPPPAPAPTSESLKLTVPLFSFSGASPSSTTTLAASSASSAPRFSFGQPSTTSTSAPSCNQSTGAASQPKSFFRFGQPLPDATNGAAVVSAADESKRLTIPMSTSGIAANSSDPAKPSLFGITSSFGSSTFPSASATNLFGRPVVVDNTASIPTPPKPALISTPTGPPTSSNGPIFSFGETHSSSKSADGSEPPSLPEGVAGGSSVAGIFGSKGMENKPTFTFGPSADKPKPSSAFGDNTETSLKPPFAFGSSAGGAKPTFAFGVTEAPKPASVLSGTVEESTPTSPLDNSTESNPAIHPAVESSKSASLFTTASDISKPSHSTGPSKPTPTPGNGALNTLPSTSPFSFGKDDATTTKFTPTSTQSKPAGFFTFGAPSSGSMFGQQSASATSGDSVFSKPGNATLGAFGFSGAGATGSSNTFTFGKPATQNQKQEQ